MLSHPTTILMLGTDNARVGGREGDMHSDSIMLLRTDPSHHRLYYLSIPRDIQVPIPGGGTQKINAAFQLGGPALAIRTIRAVHGARDRPRDGRQLRRLQGSDRRARRRSTSTVPKPIRSNRFDCPYSTQARCDQWPGWRFEKGTQHMSGSAR